VHVAHTPNEHVRIDELECAVQSYERLALGAIERLRERIRV
jgi:acetylornithine deacetylase/succinyl-diaminopimelate desuccinylase-like protein